MNQPSAALEKRCAFFIPVLVFVTALLPACAAFDKDPDRGATTVKQDVFGDQFDTVEYLPSQNWQPADSLWFYSVTQGSDMMPYDFFMVLEKKGTSEPFRSNENMNRYRYLPQKPTSSNPDALPVGFVKDTYKGNDYVGLTCAACHTGQINYKGKGIRIDGGPAGADMETFMADIVRAMKATRENEEVQNRFVKNVLARGTYKTEADVKADLQKYTERLVSYITINYSTTHYGYARLDAFGRIYNRVLEHIVTVKELKDLLSDPWIMKNAAISEEELESIAGNTDRVLSGEQRDQIVRNLLAVLTRNRTLEGLEPLGKLRNKLFNPPNAPVSYPFLWDTPQHDYVQWNGLTENSGLKAIARNAGEAIGVFGTLDWTERDGFSLPALITGQGLFGRHISYDSSVNVLNLRRIEARLLSLQSPQWPENILPPFDRSRLVKGKSLFNRHCVSCHSNIKRDDTDRRVVAHMSRASDVGTDPQMAENSVNYQGFSGIQRNRYVSAGGVGDILLDQRAPVSALLTKATIGVVATPEPDKWFLQRWSEWLYNLATGFRDNAIKPSIKRGDYDPDTTANPVASLKAYKARPLNGIWATAPYLHNGSVPTLYDLLLPKKRPGDADDGEYRPDEFEVGSREFDPAKVGFKSSGYGGFLFNTKGIKDDRGGYTKGNSNAGHEYGVRRMADESNGPVDQKIKDQCTDENIKDEDPSIKDKCLYPMSREDRLDLLEYLKTL
ncbi:MAG: di-heme-cytochrome C peroxidase [Nitrosospira sp.]